MYFSLCFKWDLNIFKRLLFAVNNLSVVRDYLTKEAIQMKCEMVSSLDYYDMSC